MEYYWTVPNDGNRDKDGKDLRTLYSEEVGYYDCNIPDGPARVLEVFIALSMRMEEELDGHPACKTAAGFFWEMIDNLGLSRYDDMNIDEKDRIIIHEIMGHFMGHLPFKSVPLSIFPSHKLEENGKPKELWYQMYDYIEENYSFLD